MWGLGLSQKGCGKCRMSLRGWDWVDISSLLQTFWGFFCHPDEPYLQKLETGTQMSLPVEAKPVWWCIISQLQTLVWEGHTFINGTMTDATWSTILSANMPQVGKIEVIFHWWDIVLFVRESSRIFWPVVLVPLVFAWAGINRGYYMSITFLMHLNKPVYI